MANGVFHIPNARAELDQGYMLSNWRKMAQEVSVGHWREVEAKIYLLGIGAEIFHLGFLQKRAISD